MNFDHKPHRGDKLQPLDEISGYKVRPGFYDRNGAAQAANGVSFTIHSMGRPDVHCYCSAPKEQEPFAKNTLSGNLLYWKHIFHAGIWVKYRRV